jgi:hypothetical protein
MYRPLLVAISLLVFSVLTVSAQAQTAQSADVPPFVQRGMRGPMHERLDALVGDWKVESSFMVAGGTAEKPLHGEQMRTHREWVAGHYLQDTTQGMLAGSPYFRIGYLGYSTMDKRYEWITMDAVNANMMIYQGKPGSDALNMSGTFTDQGVLGEDMVGKEIGQRSEFTIETPDRHVLRMYFTPPGGREFLAAEMIYTRTL